MIYAWSGMKKEWLASYDPCMAGYELGMTRYDPGMTRYDQGVANDCSNQVIYLKPEFFQDESCDTVCQLHLDHVTFNGLPRCHVATSRPGDTASCGCPGYILSPFLLLL